MYALNYTNTFYSSKTLYIYNIHTECMCTHTHTELRVHSSLCLLLPPFAPEDILSVLSVRPSESAMEPVKEMRVEPKVHTEIPGRERLVCGKEWHGT